MGYSSGMLRDRVEILNRRDAHGSRFGLDSAGVEYETAGSVPAEVSWAKGKQAMNAGALDAYAVKMVRMRWTSKVNERSRIVCDGTTYQILPDTFNESFQDNTIQFLCQRLVNPASYDEQ